MRTPLHLGLRAALFAAALTSTLGCAGPSHFANPRADLSTMEKVAVLPFENMSEERLAGEKVQRLFVAELLNGHVFEVIEPARVVRALRDERIESPGAMTPDELLRVAKSLKADGIFSGTVLDYSDSKGVSGAAPVVTVQFKLVDSATATTVWAVTRHKSGTSLAAKLFGFAATPSTVVATEVVRDAVSTIRR